MQKRKSFTDDKAENDKKRRQEEDTQELEEETQSRNRQNSFGEDPFYNPKADDNDAFWVSKNLSSKRNWAMEDYNSSESEEEELEKLKVNSSIKATGSDAVLNCPCCFSVLSVDCQAHASYQGQYRAMFVTNCRVDGEEPMTYNNKQKKSRSGDDNGEEVLHQLREGISNNVDYYYPVHCTICNTKVAFYDKDEVYHFFEVFASYA